MATVGLPKRSRETLRDFVEQRYLPWAEQRKRTWLNDRATLRSKILPKLGSLALSDVTRERVERYLKDRLSEVKPASANREAALLRKMLNLAVEWNLLDINPLARLRLFPESPQRLPSLSFDDEARLLAAAQEWLRPVLAAALLTGARRGELLALRWRNVDFDNGLLVIEDSKTGTPRHVPLHPFLAAELRARRGLPEGNVFTMPDGTPVDGHSCSQAFRRLVRKLTLPLRFHDLRHVAATRMLSGGSGVLQIAGVLGHKTLAMTRRYSHVSIADMRDAVSRLPAPRGETTGERA